MEIINGKKNKRLTIAELRNCKGFENFKDEEAEKTIDTLETLSILLFQLHTKEQLSKKNLRLLKKQKTNEDEHRNAA